VVGGDGCGGSVRRRVGLLARQCASARASIGSRGGRKLVVDSVARERAELDARAAMATGGSVPARGKAPAPFIGGGGRPVMTVG
jgi:hypothetical protein